MSANIESARNYSAALPLTAEQKKDIEKLAAAGMAPRAIARAIDLDGSATDIFCLLADLPGSEVFALIESGVAHGVADPVVSLIQSASAGNVESVRELNKMRADNRYYNLLNNMDDDELAF